MDALQDFEDMLLLLKRHNVRYLIIGGLAFIYHAKPRYTKDMDLWIESSPENIGLANKALAEFGSPALIDQDDPDQIIIQRSEEAAGIDECLLNFVRHIEPR